MRVVILLIITLHASILAQAQIDFKKYHLAYDTIKAKQADRKIGKKLRRHYLHGAGTDYKLSKSTIENLARTITKRKLLLRNKKLIFLRKEGNIFWYSISTYPTKYSVLFGRADVGFKLVGENQIELVALEDYYDFNFKKLRKRPIFFELITRLTKKIVYSKRGLKYRYYYEAS